VQQQPSFAVLATFIMERAVLNAQWDISSTIPSRGTAPGALKGSIRLLQVQPAAFIALLESLLIVEVIGAMPVLLDNLQRKGEVLSAPSARRVMPSTLVISGRCALVVVESKGGHVLPVHQIM
jgi:hypothetical protein